MNIPRLSVLCLLCLWIILDCNSCRNGEQTGKPGGTGSYSSYVDPFIGSGGAGHTFPGATLPFGMIQLSPDTRVDGSPEGSSGYHDPDSLIYGFSHTHLSGTGCSEFGDILLMPGTGEPSLDNIQYVSSFSRKTEKAQPGYYAVHLNKGNIDVELTATLRAGMHKYIFTEGGKSNVVVDLLHRDKTLESRLEVRDMVHVEGMRRSEGPAKDQQIYFSLEFSKPFTSSLLMADAKEGEATMTGKDRGGVFTFDMVKGDSLFVKIGISPVSMEGARRNLKAEITGWDFRRIRQDASEAWDRELGRIEVKSPDAEQLKMFYTALYHTMMQPNLGMDADSMYRGRDHAVHKAAFTYYSDFFLPETFRNLYPLYTLIEPTRTVDFIKTFLTQFKEVGSLPVSEIASNEMGGTGYPAGAVMADAAVKGIKGFDYEMALEAMKKSANGNRGGLPIYRNQGYLSAEDEPESVSKTLAYACEDWCIAQMAGLLNRKADHDSFLGRSLNYRNLYDSGTGFLRPRRNGCWLDPFDAEEASTCYGGANAWQYSFFVPHDLHAFIRLQGGEEKFANHLDSLFSSNGHTAVPASGIHSLIGQYAHATEAGHHAVYLFDYCGKPWKTQKYVHRILSTCYNTSREGLAGREGSGEMSAWYVWSAMGIYPVTPGSAEYATGAPLFPSVIIHLENGKQFTILADQLSPQNYFVSKREPANLMIQHATILSGGMLRFTMVAEPDTAGGGKSAITWKELPGDSVPFVGAPVFETTSQLFRTKAKISIAEMQPGTSVHYTIDGSLPGWYSPQYKKPFSIENTSTVRAIAYLQSDTSVKSGLTSGTFHQYPNWWTIHIKSPMVVQYNGGGQDALIDGIRGDLNWGKGNWQGYLGTDFDAVVDLGKSRQVSHVSVGFLQDAGAGILFPRDVDYFFSADGITFKHIVTADNSVSELDEKIQMREFGSAVRKQKTRYIRIHATTYGRLPEQHAGISGKALLFLDEITVE